MLQFGIVIKRNKVLNIIFKSLQSVVKYYRRNLVEYYKISNTELISIYSDSLCNGFKINSNEVLELEEEFTYRIFSEEEFQIIKLITTGINRNIYSKLHTKLENFNTPLSNYNFSESIFTDIFKVYRSISKEKLINKFLQS